MASDPRISCFACGELNTPDSRFCKFCGRALVEQRQQPTVAQDPRNRLMLALVLILLLACVVFGIFGLVSSKVFGRPAPAAAAIPERTLVITTTSSWPLHPASEPEAKQ